MKRTRAPSGPQRSPARGIARSFWTMALASLSCLLLTYCSAGSTGESEEALSSAASSSVTFVQGAANVVSAGAANTAPFSSSNNAGDLIIASAMWTTGSLSSIVDSLGNVYQAATPLVTSPGGNHEQVFYAKNVKSGSNKVTITFGASNHNDLYIYEYAGADRVAPFDVSATATGTSSVAPNSGPVTITSATELIFGSILADTSVSGTGSGFLARSTADGNLTEDRFVSSLGSYSAGAGSSSQGWAAQVATFKAASSSGTDAGSDTGAKDAGGNPTFTLVVSTSPQRSSPVALNGATLSGMAYVFTSDSSHTPNPAGIAQVRYWLDNTAMSGTPTHVENAAPYDFAGTASGGTADPWDTSTVAHGTHTITQSVTPASGSVQNYTATFTVSSAIVDAGSDATHDAGSKTYMTNFLLTENPISESGNWVGGQAAGGNLWGNVRTTPSLAFGVSEPTTYGDPTAVLTGTWGPTQTASATVRIVTPPTGGCCHEAEVRLRMTISSDRITGYEVYCSVMQSNPYCHIARWNGPNGSWCNIESSETSTYLVNGDVLKGTVSGTNPVVITGYKNGAQVAFASDTGGNCSPGGPAGPWTTGSPGIGFYDNADSNWSSFGFSSFTATGQ